MPPRTPKSRKNLITKAWRLLIDGPLDGAHNMCCDEALLLEGKQPTLRLYSWQEPTVSYGYFQRHEDFNDIPDHYHRVRRLTGGGAIVHHHEITYSFTCPIDHTFVTSNSEELYCNVHKAWQVALNTIKAPTEFRCGQRSTTIDQWCFAKGDPLDLVDAQGAKIVGSAQRRTANGFLMHGSIPLTTQKLMGGSSLEDLCERPMNWHDTVNQLLKPFTSELDITVEPGTLTEIEKQKIAEIKKHRYSTKAWIEDRKFDSF